MKFVLVFILLALAVGAPSFLYVTSTTPVLTLDPVKVVGFGTPLNIKVENPHGERLVTATLEQDGKSYPVKVAESPAQRFRFKAAEKPLVKTLQIGKQTTPALHDGKARITVTAVSNDFRGTEISKSLDVDVMTAPPRISADGAQHYINQGGSELVILTPGGTWTEAGVRVGDQTFRAFPLEGQPGQFVSLFGFFWNLPLETPVGAYASNPSGAVAKASFWYKIFPKKFRKSTIRLEDMGVERIVNQIDPNGKIQGNTIERFVKINSELRKQNNKTLADLRLETAPKFLWTGAFLPMVDSTVESRFADDRVYTWQGKQVDEQTHLGFDLAKLSHTPVPASNDGKVLWAEDLGIYGNCIVIDHGLGLQSVYGHLSEFAVKKGDMVRKGQIIGKTGSTGLAGGDHLHFTMQIEGVQINPAEWWDPHWVRDRILSKMGTAMSSDAGTDAYADAVNAHRKERGAAAPAKKRRKK